MSKTTAQLEAQLAEFAAKIEQQEEELARQVIRVGRAGSVIEALLTEVRKHDQVSLFPAAELWLKEWKARDEIAEPDIFDAPDTFPKDGSGCP